MGRMVASGKIHLWWLPSTIGPFASLGVFPYSAWVLAALAAALRSAWLTRALLVLALVLSAAVVIVAEFTSYLAPQLPDLIPLCGLGVLALARRAPRSLWSRLAPAVAVAAAAAVTWSGGLPQRGTTFRIAGPQPQLVGLALVLLGGTLLAGLAYRLWRDARGLWAALFLLPPAVLLFDLPYSYEWGFYGIWHVAGRAVLDLALSAAVVYLVMLIAAGRRTPDVCPACGHLLTPAPPRTAIR
jgi:hypothetical protein